MLISHDASASPQRGSRSAAVTNRKLVVTCHVQLPWSEASQNQYMVGHLAVRRPIFSLPNMAKGATATQSRAMTSKLNDELADLERYVASCREQSLRALSALKESSLPSSALGGDDVANAKLEGELSRLQKSYQDLRQQHHSVQQENERVLQECRVLKQRNSELSRGSDAGRASKELHNQIHQRDQELSQLRESARKHEEEVAALKQDCTDLKRQCDKHSSSVVRLTDQCAQLQAELTSTQTALNAARADAQKSKAAAAVAAKSASLGPSPSATPPAASPSSSIMPATSAAVLEELRQKVASLQNDKQYIEDIVVSMYEELFSDEILSKCVNVVRRKEIDVIASADARGGKRGTAAGGKAAPRLKQKLDDATTRIEQLEKELSSRKDEIGAMERHHADLLKIQKLESEAQITHFKVRPLHSSDIGLYPNITTSCCGCAAGVPWNFTHGRLTMDCLTRLLTWWQTDATALCC